MRKRSVPEMVRRLETAKSFKSWKNLPAAFLEETAELSPDEAIDLADRLWQLCEHRFLYAASTLLHRHPTALSKVQWKVLEPLGNRMDDWGSVDMFVTLAGPAWRENRLSDTRIALVKREVRNKLTTGRKNPRH